MADDELATMDDPEFLAERRRVREELERTVTADIATLPARAARMAAVEILLANPEALDDDVLEACLYILREKLRAA